MDREQYRIDEIKYKIDTVIQVSMFYNENNSNLILEIQRKLYEEFGIM